jgi:hypothetical protein
MPAIIATGEAAIGKDHGSWAKVQTPPQPIKSWVWWHMPVVSAMQKVYIGGLGPGHKCETLFEKQKDWR